MRQNRTYATGDIAGAILLVLALFLFGLFNFKSDEPLVEAGLAVQADAVAAQSVHAVQVTLDGRDMTLTGLADSEEEKTRLLAALRQVEGRGRIRSDVTVLAPAAPFILSARKHPGAGLHFSGAVPTEALRETLRARHGDGVDDLELASGMPDAAWPDVAQRALDALARLRTGALRIEDTALALSGTALTPDVAAEVRQALSDLPEGYTSRITLDVADDGTPLRLTAARRAGTLTEVIGKLPSGDAEPWPEGNIVRSDLPPPFPGWSDAVRQGLAALAHLHDARLTMVGPVMVLTGDAWSPAEEAAAHAALADPPAALALSVQIALVDDGAPFRLLLDKQATGVHARGKVPRSLGPPVLAALAGAPVSADNLVVAPRADPGAAWWQAASLGAGALALVESGRLEFDGAVLSLTARVADPPALARLRSHLAALPGGVSLQLQPDLIDDGTPLRLILAHDGAAAQLGGKLPAGVEPAALAAPLTLPVTQAADLQRSPQPAPPGWAEAARLGAAALGLFRQGQMTLGDGRLRLTGVLRDPASEAQVTALLDGLPEGYAAQIDARFQDDGRPFAFALDYDGAGAVLSGKVPRDLGPASQAAILGRPVTAADLEFSEIAADVDWWSAARDGLKALAELERGRLTLDAHRLTLHGAARDAAAADAARARLAPLAGAFAVEIELTVD